MKGRSEAVFSVCSCDECSKLLKPKSTILSEASKITSGARPSRYGTPKDNHSRTASFWSIYLGIDISPRQVCMMNMLQKISRDMHQPYQDNLIDIAGFAQNADDVSQEE